MADNIALLHRWFDEVWNKGRESAIDELMAKDCIAHGLQDGMDVTGTAPFKEFHRAFLARFPNAQIELADALQDGDRTAVRCLVTGNEAGTGKPVKFSGMVISRWRDGKIVEAWNNFDFHLMELQLR